MTASSKKSYLVLAIVSALFIGAVTFVFMVYKSFFWSAFISLILYAGSRDYYVFIKKKLPRKISDFAPIIMIILMLIILVIPSYFILSALLKEFLSFLFLMKVNLSEEKFLPFLMNLPLATDYFTDTEFFWVNIPNMYRDIVTSYGDILNFDSIYGLLSNATSLILEGVKLPLEIIVNTLFSFMLLFFLYKDGYKLENFFQNNLPISDEFKLKIGYRVREAVKAVLKGNFVISLLQGFVLGFLLFIADIPNPILYGCIGALFSLIPVVGTGVVWLPAGLYMGIAESNWIGAVIFMSLSFTSYLLLENLVKPNFLDKKLNLHPFLLFLSLLGGINEFGIPGLVIGPVAVTLVVIVWDFWKEHKHELPAMFKD
ncbi:MAG TPA: AI-2E family transporter [Leptospiraceae bacterium]|nr:AI-2E family transporter [Leptospiraceae bacterium]HNF12533.1 AI-2E family transporter [Leptospiraceae bacterium]HNI96103.1 AI-2E family transporter [Leptospiraceae bacterium]HNN06160.1 AI-2E family transporter [Leptospiraceae bacterium]HNO24047.1 AI-2E family transporter [Leptospiraceae bacterium]